jgi:outer membrane protein assembly factor BamB
VSLNFGLGGPEPPVPVAADGVVAVLGTGQLAVHDAATGDERWRTRFSPNGPFDQVAIERGVVYLGDAADLRALDARSGDPLWTVELASRPIMPLVTDGRLYLLGIDPPQGPMRLCAVSPPDSGGTPSADTASATAR